MDKSRDPDPQGRHDRAFWTGQKGHLRRKEREDDQTRKARDSKFPKKALL